MRTEYRDYTAKDNAVQVMYPSARTVTLSTNLDGEDAQALADKMLEDSKNPVVVMEIDFAGTMELDSLVGQNPSAIVNLPKFAFPDRLMRITSVTTNYEANTTTVTVRG